MEKPLSRAAMILRNSDKINERNRLEMHCNDGAQASTSENSVQVGFQTSRSGRKLTASKRSFSNFNMKVRPENTASTPKVKKIVSRMHICYCSVGVQ